MSASRVYIGCSAWETLGCSGFFYHTTLPSAIIVTTHRWATRFATTPSPSLAATCAALTVIAEVVPGSHCKPIASSLTSLFAQYLLNCEYLFIYFFLNLFTMYHTVVYILYMGVVRSWQWENCLWQPLGDSGLPFFFFPILVFCSVYRGEILWPKSGMAGVAS